MTKRKFLSMPKNYYRPTKEDYDSMNTQEAVNYVLDDSRPHPDDKDLYRKMRWNDIFLVVFVTIGMCGFVWIIMASTL